MFAHVSVLQGEGAGSILFSTDGWERVCAPVS